MTKPLVLKAADQTEVTQTCRTPIRSTKADRFPPVELLANRLEEAEELLACA